jgi:OOP family OmpA-OmpF porin
MANTEDDKSGGGDIDTEYWHIDGLYHFEDASSRWAPYLVAGIGQQKFDASMGSEDDAQLNAGVGIKYKMTSNFHFRSDVRATVGADEADVGGLFNLGLVYIFGDSNKSSDDISAAEEQRAEFAEALNEEQAADIEEFAAEAELEEQAELAGEVLVALIDSDNDGIDDNNDNCASSAEGVVVDANGCELDSDGDGVVDSQDKCPNTTQKLKVGEDGCYADLTEAVSFQLNVNFASGSAVLTDDSKVSTDELAELMQNNASARVAVIGYTDNTGSAALNQKLSQKRAESVKAALLEAGIDAERVTAKGMGDKDPVADNNTVEGRKANRRVMADISTQ